MGSLRLLATRMKLTSDQLNATKKTRRPYQYCSSPYKFTTKCIFSITTHPEKNIENCARANLYIPLSHWFLWRMLWIYRSVQLRVLPRLQGLCAEPLQDLLALQLVSVHAECARTSFGNSPHVTMPAQLGTSSQARAVRQGTCLWFCAWPCWRDSWLVRTKSKVDQVITLAIIYIKIL